MTRDITQDILGAENAVKHYEEKYALACQRLHNAHRDVGDVKRNRKANVNRALAECEEIRQGLVDARLRMTTLKADGYDHARRAGLIDEGK